MKNSFVAAEDETNGGKIIETVWVRDGSYPTKSFLDDWCLVTVYKLWSFRVTVDETEHQRVALYSPGGSLSAGTEDI